MHDAHTGQVRTHPPVAQIDERRRRFYRAVLHQDRGLLQLLGQGVPVIRVAMKRPRTHDQVVFERAGDAYLHPELVGRAGLAFADAVDIGRVPGVQLGLPDITAYRPEICRD